MHGPRRTAKIAVAEPLRIAPEEVAPHQNISRPTEEGEVELGVDAEPFGRGFGGTSDSVSWHTKRDLHSLSVIWLKDMNRMRIPSDRTEREHIF